MSYEKESKPETVEDLTARERTGEMIATIRLSAAAVSPRLASALAAALEVAEMDSRVDLDPDGYGATISVALTEEELQDRLVASRRSWDDATVKLQRLLDGEELTSWEEHVARIAGEARGLDLPPRDKEKVS